MNDVKITGTFSGYEVAVKRDSGAVDTIPINIYVPTNSRQTAEGEFRSRNEGGHLRLYFKVNRLSDASNQQFDDNRIILAGYLCKTPIRRVTPAGKIITDLLFAVHRNNETASDYIPAVAWGSVAEQAAGYHIGDYLTAEGRIQSRTYTKDGQRRTAYEVSINTLSKREK